MKKERRQLRLIVQLACLFAAIVLLWPISGWIEGSRLFPQLSPFVAICATIAGRTIGVGLGIGWILAAMVIFRPRWFCRYLCPAGLLFEESARIGLRKTSWWTRCPAVGRYIALITAIGAIVGYPLLLWLDPLSIFGSALTAFTAKTAASKILAGALLGILVILSATSGSLWCSRLCPLGGTQDLLGRVKSLFSETFTHNVPKNAQSHNARTDTLLVRRSFILFTAGIGIAIWGKASGAARGENAPLRPPGAVAEETFAGLCFRCGNCVRTCPSGIIHPDLGQAGVAGLLAPIIRYESRYCIESCRSCMQVCPSGAIKELDLVHKRRYQIGEALVDGGICLLTLEKRDCDACARSCPFDAIKIHWDEQLYVAYPLVDFAKCNGCGACEVACPCKDIKAIRVWRNNRTNLIES
jgi:ferredoxin-type protein NapF